MASINNIISSAIFANLLRSANAVNTSVLNLSGGVKTNASVADYSVGSILQYQSSALTAANINAGNGTSLVNTANNALAQIIQLLNDQKSLANQAQDASLTDNERANLNLQFQDNTAAIDRIADTTKFGGKLLLNGSISGTANLTTQTGQADENYTLLSTGDYSLSGTTAAGNLTTSSVFAPVATNSIGKTAASATLSFGGVGGAVTNAVIAIGGQSITFSSGGTATAAATAFVAAAEASTNNTVRQFTYKDNGNGTVTVTGADLGTAANTTTFALTNLGGNITANTVTFGGSNIDTTGAGAAKSITTSSSGIVGTNQAVATDDITLDSNLQGSLTGFTATLDTSGTQNTAVFTVNINGQTYTSQPITLFGTGGFNSKGNTIKNGQVLTFYNSAGPKDGSGNFTDNAFSLTVGGSDITVTGGSADAFQTSLSNIATGFGTQLAANSINQSRSLILPETNPEGADFTISTAPVGTTFAGIKGYDAVGTNNKGDINFIGDTFGSDGNNSSIGSFSYDPSTHKITTTIGGEVYTADLSTSVANLAALTTEGLANGTGGSFDTATNILTAGAGTTIVFHSASTTDGKELTLDLSNLNDKTIDINSPAGVTAFTDDLNNLFGVSNNQSLTYQVGTDSSNVINFALGSATSSSLYKDDSGATQALDISTTTGAIQASNVIDNSINNALSLSATANAALSSFNSAVAVNNVEISNYDAASSTLLNTDYASESTNFAENTLRYNVGLAVLAQQQNKLQDILKLLS